MKDRIFAETFRLVSRYGIRVINMDSLAKEMNVSKKTIYQYYKNKDELITDCVNHIIAGLNERIAETVAGDNNPLTKICDIYSFSLDVILQLPPVFFFDLRKYHPAANKVMQEFREHLVFMHITKLLEEAREQNLLLENVDTGFVCGIHFFRILEIIESMYARQHINNHDALFDALIVNSLRGILKSNYMHLLEHYQRRI